MLRFFLRPNGHVFFMMAVALAVLGGGGRQTRMQTAVAQEAPDRDRGRIAVASKPDGSTVFVSLELALEGKFDGLIERSFVLQRASEPPPAFQGSGRVETVGRGAFLDSLRLALDDGGLWVFVATPASDDTRSTIPSGGRVFEVDRIIQAWSVRPDSPLMAPGSPGTGRISHEDAVKDLFSRPNP